MNNAFLVSVLHRLANFNKKSKPILGRQFFLIAIICDPNSTHELHDEIRASTWSCASIEYFRNIRMVHHRQGLTFRLETGDNLFRVHPKLKDLQGDSAPHGFILLRHPNDSPAPFADLF